MGLDGLRQFRVVRLVARVGKQDIENRQPALIISKLVEKARVSPALPQPGRFIQRQPRGIVHFDDDHIVSNRLLYEDKRQVIAQVTQGSADLKPP